MHLFPVGGSNVLVMDFIRQYLILNSRDSKDCYAKKRLIVLYLAVDAELGFTLNEIVLFRKY